ncbi:glycerophosphodiester phosphodiesterase [Radiobacillus sp. PE A8.2]|uniref:glycerophosphodiester phosphodiesterase n=1 Tax=Radiobacillus sp. PE A8.2 TaxID=3380349 RepID=UPI00389005E3
MPNIINYAHRGASAYYPENTLIAFEKAIELGATGIETDVQMTRDGELVLIHDESLQRTTGINSLVKDISYDLIKDADAGSWFHQDFSTVRIPKLAELLELVKDTNVTINIELKNGILFYPTLEEKVIELIRTYGITDRVILSSFNHYSLVKVKEIAPEITTGVLFMEGLYQPWNYAKQLGATALHAITYATQPELVAEARNYGIIYNTFTVNNKIQMEQLISGGVAGIITDYPDRLAEVLGSKEDIK